MKFLPCITVKFSRRTSHGTAFSLAPSTYLVCCMINAAQESLNKSIAIPHHVVSPPPKQTVAPVTCGGVLATGAAADVTRLMAARLARSKQELSV